MKPICIYHANCLDGFAAAYAVWRRHGDDIEYQAANYGDAPPDVAGRDVIIVDFSYKRPVLDQMIESCRSMLILDHHKTARDDLDGIFEHPKVDGRFDMTMSGATLAWAWFHDTPPPREFLCIEDRDLWRWRHQDSRPFTSALRTYRFAFDVWDTLFAKGGMERLVAMGQVIEQYRSQKVDEAVKTAARACIAGHDVLVANVTGDIISEVAGALSHHGPFGATFFVSPGGDYVYSLRSQYDVDVSEIAKQFGGGGHAQAAGFRVDKPVHALVAK